MIKISVVVPVYNTSKYLSRCLRSILSQSFEEIEIIIINDGSTDNSLEIIKEYSYLDNRIIIINKKNGGLSSARNEGIKIARGEYVVNIDSDDWIEQDYFKDMYNIAKEKNADIVVSDFYVDFSNNNIDYKKDLNLENNSIISGQIYIEKFLNNEIFPAVWNKMFRLDLYKNNNILHPVEISLGEDLVATLKLAHYAKTIAKNNKAYVHYMQNDDSITKSSPTKKIYELISAFKILNLFFDKKINFDRKKIENYGCWLYNINYNIDEKYYKEAIVEYIKLCQKIKIGKSNNLGFKLNIYIIFLKLIPSYNTFKIIYKFNKKIILLKEKNKIKKNKREKNER